MLIQEKDNYILSFISNCVAGGFNQILVLKNQDKRTYYISLIYKFASLENWDLVHENLVYSIAYIENDKYKPIGLELDTIKVCKSYNKTAKQAIDEYINAES